MGYILHTLTESPPVSHILSFLRAVGLGPALTRLATVGKTEWALLDTVAVASVVLSPLSIGTIGSVDSACMHE